MALCPHSGQTIGAGVTKKQTINQGPDIEFKFVTLDKEYETYFTMRNGFSISDMNDSIAADLDDNLLVIELHKKSHVQAFVSAAITDNKLRLDIAGVSFELLTEGALFSMKDNMIVQVSVFIDPVTAKVENVSTNR